MQGLRGRTMDANSGEAWSEMDISNLTNEIAQGRTMAETASFLCRDEDEVRGKMKELGLEEHPGKRRAFAKAALRGRAPGR
jgi:hypothetical protein